MSTLLVDTPPLIAVSVIFGLSLGGAYVLFQTLKATAVMKTVRGQAGGALAGFLMVFSALGGTYFKLLPAAEDLKALTEENRRLEATIEGLQATIQDFERQTESEVWTLTGEVRRQGHPSAEGVSVLVFPPKPQTILKAHGEFTFNGVEVVNGSWPWLRVSVDGYHPTNLQLSPDLLQLDEGQGLASLKQPIELVPLAAPEGTVVAHSGAEADASGANALSALDS